jgi:hypothetical protein
MAYFQLLLKPVVAIVLVQTQPFLGGVLHYPLV